MEKILCDSSKELRLAKDVMRNPRVWVLQTRDSFFILMNKKENRIDVVCVPQGNNGIGLTTNGLGRWYRGKVLVLQKREFPDGLDAH